MLNSIHSLTLEKVLSFGGKVELPLHALNVLIGPNGSGKSNLIDCIGLMRSMSGSPADEIRQGGSAVRDWFWRGEEEGSAKVQLTWEDADLSSLVLSHTVEFKETGNHFDMLTERIDQRLELTEAYVPVFCGGSRFDKEGRSDNAVLFRGTESENISFDTSRSILAQRNDPKHYPVLDQISQFYYRSRIYRDWSFGRSSVFRQPQRADSPNHYLMEDGSNLGLVLSRLRRNPAIKDELVTKLNELYPNITDYEVSIEGGFVQLFLREDQQFIPATRLSDGTLRYLCLLVLLCDPSPPPLVCIEEPELGLHPDVVRGMAGLLKSASERTQLIVTTHSPELIDGLSDSPEDIVVVERGENGSEARRLESGNLASWLEEYRLGELWGRGVIGGNRW